MTINHNAKCDSCKESLSKIGQTVHLNGGNVGDTDHTFYQCGDCGSVWLEVQDIGGIGGNGTYMHSLTERFF